MEEKVEKGGGEREKQIGRKGEKREEKEKLGIERKKELG